LANKQRPETKVLKDISSEAEKGQQESNNQTTQPALTKRKGQIKCLAKPSSLEMQEGKQTMKPKGRRRHHESDILK
jgi:hypothetical protein